jgi:hypothetical protein
VQPFRDDVELVLADDVEALFGLAGTEYDLTRVD